MNHSDNNWSTEQTLITIKPSTWRWLIGSFVGLTDILLCLFYGVGLLLIFLQWLRNVTTRYTVTDQRIKLETGIIFRRVDEIELYRVKDVRVDYSLLNRIVNIGTIRIVSSDPTTNPEPLLMRSIANARGVRELLRNNAERIRRQRGVREVDFDRMPYAG
jgi:uncharacterized membrane protein YdbT with pleckstrin-like domain